MKIVFILPNKEEKTVEGRVGAPLLEIAEENDLPLFGGCGGSGICGSCRVRIAPEWMDRLPPPGDSEQDTLEALQADDGVRLACQVVLTETCDGLRVYLTV